MKRLILLIAISIGTTTLSLGYVSHKETYTKYTIWNPSTANLATNIAPGDTESFYDSDQCIDDSTVVPSTGSLPTTGPGSPSLPWDGWFTSLFDTITPHHKKNYGSTTLHFQYHLTTCTGYEKFVGDSSGNVYKRNGSEWDYTGLFDPE